MFNPIERRTGPRRTEPRAEEAKRSDRRTEERRDAPRLRRIVEVFSQGLTRVDKRTAVFSLEGMSWTAESAAKGDRFVVQLHLDKPYQVTVEAVRVRPVRAGVHVEALFVLPDVAVQVALARQMERSATR